MGGSILRQVEKAIQTSDLGINPQNDGKLIRLTFPPLTEERRKELIKQVSKIGEESKVAIRNVRREAIDKCKAAQKKSEMTEDELHEGEEKMQKLTDKYVKEDRRYGREEVQGAGGSVMSRKRPSCPGKLKITWGRRERALCMGEV